MILKPSVVLFAALTASALSWGQTSLYDRVIVDFNYSVNVNGTVIPAGHYQIMQLRSAGQGSRILFVESDNGTRFEASGATIAILENEPPGETRVILQRIGQNYYLNRIWISGKTYGYEFPLPAEAKALMQERAEPITLTASYRPEPVAQAEAPAPPPKPAPEPEPAPAPAPPPEPAPAPEPAPQPAPAPEPQPPPPEQPPAQPTMPATADNWATFVTLGGALTALGLMLRRK